MAGRRQLPLRGQVSQERLDLRATHLGRMPEFMKTDECASPVHVGPFCLQAVVNQPAMLANLIEQPHRLKRWKTYYWLWT
jgi:hypothetical protein